MKNQIIVVLIIILFISPLIAFQQDSYSDSLLQLIPSQEEGKKAGTYVKLSTHLLRSDPDRAKEYGIKAFEIYASIKDQEGIFNSTKWVGYACMFMSDYSTAAEYYLFTLEAAEKLGETEKILNAWYYLGQAYDFGEKYTEALNYYQRVIEEGKALNDTNQVSRALYGTGNIYLITGRHDEAMKFYQEALRLTEGNPGYDDMTNSLYNGVGNVYYEWEDYELALDYYRKARDLNYKVGNDYSLAHSYNNIGRIYYQWEAHDEARKYYEMADSIFSDMGHVTGQSMALYNLGLIYEKTGNGARALEHYRANLDLNTRINSKKVVADTYGAIAEYYLNSRQYDSAIFYADLMMAPAEEIDHKVAVMNSYSFKAQSYEELGRFDEALENYKKFLEVKNSHFSADVEERMRLTAMVFEHEKAVESRVVSLQKENENKEARIRQSRIYMIGMGGFILLMIITGVLIFRNYRLLNIQRQLLLEQRLLRSQMNPHFIFNALTSIQGFMYKKDVDRAARYLSNFSKLIRNILESSREDAVPLEKEISSITNYLELQKLRYGDRFDYEIDGSEEFDFHEVKIPPMLIQPFIENAIEHGIKNKEEQGHIRIRYYLKKKSIIFEVEDDGIGRQRAKEIAIARGQKHKSLATTITKERIETLNRELRQKISINIIDLADKEGNPAGTKVIFEIPIRN